MGLALENDEFVDIFVEEVDEVLAQIGLALPLWKANPHNKKVLQEIQRAFYTLKSSGRVVDANQISELSLATEHLLNRVMSGELNYHVAVFNLLEKSYQTIPLLAKALHNRQAVAIAGVNVDALINDITSYSSSKAEQASNVTFIPSEELKNLELEQVQSKLDDCYQRLDNLRQDWLDTGKKLDEIEEKLQEDKSLAIMAQLDQRLEYFQQSLRDLEYSIKATGEATFNDISTTQQRLSKQIDQELRIAKDVVAQIKSDQQTERQVIYTEMSNKIQLWAIGCSVGTFILTVLTSIFLL